MSNRIEREVEELLAGLDALPPEKPLKRRIGDVVLAPFRAIGGLVESIHLPRINAGHLLLVAIAIVVVAYVAGGNSPLWNIIIAGGIILFIAAFILSLRKQSKPSSPRYWRDRPMDLEKGEQKSWWRRKNRR
jgi:hypothetical protein